MSTSTIAVFNDPRAFEAALQRGCTVDLLVTGQGRFQAEMVSIVLPQLGLLQARERLARIAAVSVAHGSMLIILPPEPGQPQTCGGVCLSADEIMIATPGERLHVWTRGPCNWGIISVSVKEFRRHGHAMIGRNFELASGVSRLQLAWLIHLQGRDSLADVA
jgi:hypothetical protein